MTDTLTEELAAQPADEAPKPPLAARILRGFGWTFIWLGILAMGFVFHQLYVTTWLAQVEQGALDDERLEHFAEVANQIRPVIVDADGVPIADALTGAPVDEDGLPLVPDDPTAVPSSGVPSDPSAPDATVPPSRDGDLVIFPEPRVRTGQSYANIRIPTLDSLKDGWNVIEGVKLRQLRKGAGHMPWTPHPGQIGNAVISGHRTTNGAPFHDLDKLEPGDRIEVETAVGVHVYEVRQIRIVRPNALWVTARDGPARAGLEAGSDGAWLTLTTCHPKASARQRLIVFAQMVDGPNFGTIDRLTG